MFRVILRKHAKAREVLYERCYQWNDFDKKLKFLLPGTAMETNHIDVFQLHHGFQLEEDDMIQVIHSRSMGWKGV